MRHFSAFFLSIIVGIMVTSCRDLKNEADLIIFNTTIYTIDSANTIANSLAVKDGIIVAIGSDADVRSRYWSKNILNAHGQFVYPGFIDAHSHFSGLAQYLMYADLDTAQSFQDILSIIRTYHKLHPDRWIVGRGWDQNKWPGKRYPNSRLLDQEFPDVPVVLTRVDGHAVLANRAALKKAGISEPYPAGEAILENDQPIGVFLEHTADLIKNAIPKPSDKAMAELMLEAAAMCHAQGLTGVNDAGIDKDMILFIDSLQKAGQLKLRIDAMINPTEENMDFFMPGRGYLTPYLRVGAVKIYADGALGSRGACLLHPYSDDPTNSGIMVTTPKAMRAICERADKFGFQVNTHAIGDSAVRMVLRVYQGFLQGKNDKRWRIEHAQVVDNSDFELFGKYSVIPSVQTTHATSDMGWAKARLGNTRVRNAYAYHRLLEQNGWIPNGTDFPVEKISPILSFYAAFARKDILGNPENGFQMENALSRADALKSITIWAAKAAFLEQSRGSLENGKLADIVILDKDLMSARENEIPLTKVLFTILNGEKVFEYKP